MELPDQEGVGAEEGRYRRMVRNGAALHPQDGGEVVASKGRGGEWSHTWCNKGSLGVVLGKLELVDVVVAVWVIPRNEAGRDIRRETPALDEQDSIGAPEDAAHAVSVGVARAKVGEVLEDHLHHVVRATTQGCNNPAPVVQLVVDGWCQEGAARVRA